MGSFSALCTRKPFPGRSIEYPDAAWITLLASGLVTLLSANLCCQVRAQPLDLNHPDPHAIVEWSRKIYNNGK